jgi:hypothetical protein
MYKIKIAGIYKIEHSSGFYYIGKSSDIFGRWGSHYTSIKMKKHSSPAFMLLWNTTEPIEWTFTILEYHSITEFKIEHPDLKGTELKKQFNRHQLAREKFIMKQYSINYSLNKDNKHFS